MMKINKGLFYKVKASILGTVEFSTSDSSVFIYDDGEVGLESSADNLLTKEQFDEIIRVRELLVKK